MKKNTIVWRQWRKIPPLGHGVHFHDNHAPSYADLIGFIEGFDWLRQQGVVVKGYHIKPNAVTTAEVIETMKQLLNERVAVQDDSFIGQAQITERISSCGNC